MNRFRLSCRRGTDWLLLHMREDGAIGPAEERLFYYRVPWTFALMGETGAAHRCLDWIHQYMFSNDGVFEGISPQGTFEDRYGSYPLACLLVGASSLRRHDIVYPGARALRRWQDEETGGVFNSLKDTTDTGEQVLFPTAQFGMSMILTGRLDAAIRAGEWMQRLWDLQPDVEHRLYHVFNRSQGLITDVAPGQEALYITRKDEPWQHHFNGGIAAAFLTKLFMATGETAWLELARQYQSFSMTTDFCQFQSMQTCKSGWGAGLLYTVTREPAYHDWTIRLGDWFFSHQFADGHWENTHYWNPDPTLADNIEITTEFVMHVANIISYLSLPEKEDIHG